MLLLMVNGARWMLEESPAAANELTVATCILDAVYTEAPRADPCTVALTDERETHHE